MKLWNNNRSRKKNKVYLVVHQNLKHQDENSLRNKGNVVIFTLLPSIFWIKKQKLEELLYGYFHLEAENMNGSKFWRKQKIRGVISKKGIG